MRRLSLSVCELSARWPVSGCKGGTGGRSESAGEVVMNGLQIIQDLDGLKVETVHQAGLDAAVLSAWWWTVSVLDDCSLWCMEDHVQRSRCPVRLGICWRRWVPLEGEAAAAKPDSQASSQSVLNGTLVEGDRAEGRMTRLPDEQISPLDKVRSSVKCIFTLAHEAWLTFNWF